MEKKQGNCALFFGILHSLRLQISFIYQKNSLMKKLLFFSVATIFAMALFAAFTPETKSSKTLNANNVLIPIGGTDKTISLMELSKISAADLEELTGRKMGLGERMTFKSSQRKLKKSFTEDGTITSKKILKHAEVNDLTAGFHLGGFALGFLLSIIGVVIAYLINDGKKATRVKWAWIGFAVSLAIWLIFAIL